MERVIGPNSMLPNLAVKCLAVLLIMGLMYSPVLAIEFIVEDDTVEERLVLTHKQQVSQEVVSESVNSKPTKQKEDYLRLDHRIDKSFCDHSKLYILYMQLKYCE